MATAATAADTHLTKEKAETASLTTDKATAESTYNTENAKVANLLLLSTNENTAYDTKKTDWDTKLAAKTKANYLKTKTAAVLVTATADLNAGTAGTAAKLLADETATLTTKSNAIATPLTNWTTKAKLTVKAMKEWVDAETYTDLGANFACASASGSDIVAHAAGNADAATCKTKCNGMKAWGMNGGDTFPVTAAGSGTGYCYGVQFNTGTCKHVQNSTVNKGTGATGLNCYKRVKSTKATPLVSANDLSKEGSALKNAYDAAITAWDT